MKVLHITNWYPNESNPKEALWIKNHIEAVAAHVEEYFVLHLEVKMSENFSFYSSRSGNCKRVILGIPTKRWVIIELVISIILVYNLIVIGVNSRFDVLNFHIAYPLLTYWHIIKKVVKPPVIITEHWSAYHFNFGVKKKLPRIQKIFRQGIPVMAVSKALATDIRGFSKSTFPIYILPNIVDESIFYKDPNIARENFFFMVSQWKPPKNPFIAMKAFLEFAANNHSSLKIAGYGPQWLEIEKWVGKNDLNKQIELIGELDSQEIGSFMRRCKAFLHPSNYETFSVVCAEAISCGTRVIAPNVGAIPEVVGDHGILMESNDKMAWIDSMYGIDSIQLKDIESPRFSRKSIGKQYYEVFKMIVDESKE